MFVSDRIYGIPQSTEVGITGQTAAGMWPEDDERRDRSRPRAAPIGATLARGECCSGGGALSLLGEFGRASYDTLRLGFSCLRGDAYDGFHFGLDFRF